MNAFATFRDTHDALYHGKISCEDVVRHHLSAIRTNTNLNAFLGVYEDEALTRAKAIDHKIKSGTAGKLAGMIVGLKDVLSHQHHPLHAGSRILEGFIAQYNATAVQHLLDEDAIIIGRQNCDEFGMGSSNENSAYGPTLNPIDNARVPGGSSGGSAAAVQAGMCHISLGSDTGGSVRQPASFCGVIGLKPTYSRISRNGLIAYGSSFDCIGILGKSVDDVALVLEVIAGSDPADSTCSQKDIPGYADQLELLAAKKYRVAYIRETMESQGLQREVRKAVSQETDKLRSAGHTVEQIDFPLADYVLPTYYILATAEASSNLSRYDGIRYGYRSPNAFNLESMYKKTRSEGFGKEVQRRILLGTFVLSASYYDAYYTKAQKVRRMIRNKTREVLSQYDFVITPTAPTTAFKLGEHTNDPLEMYLADLYSVQANVAGVPAISIPCGRDDSGLPVGMQIMADDFKEAELLGFSKPLIEQA